MSKPFSTLRKYELHFVHELKLEKSNSTTTNSKICPRVNICFFFLSLCLFSLNSPITHKTFNVDEFKPRGPSIQKISNWQTNMDCVRYRRGMADVYQASCFVPSSFALALESHGTSWIWMDVRARPLWIRSFYSLCFPPFPLQQKKRWMEAYGHGANRWDIE